MSSDSGTVRLDPDVIVAALEQAVMVVRPGDTLAVRCDPQMDEATITELSERTRRLLEESPCQVLFVCGEEFAVLKAGDAGGAG